MNAFVNGLRDQDDGAAPHLKKTTHCLRRFSFGVRSCQTDGQRSKSEFSQSDTSRRRLMGRQVGEDCPKTNCQERTTLLELWTTSAVGKLKPANEKGHYNIVSNSVIVNEFIDGSLKSLLLDTAATKTIIKPGTVN
ncbi:hypothetical protein HHI36_009901 [Cryptolaemus montrouzieri]|uniref:Uncharacterized protein n=1 Tax=Cryptolaemus montrouzieri TaxID=559131 RepID=A0ABD2MH84_9CUCU